MAVMEHTARSVFDDDGGEWVVYQAELSFSGRLTGGCPKDPSLVEGWMKKNLGLDDDRELARHVDRHLREMGNDNGNAMTDDEALDDAIAAAADEKHAQGFKRLETGEPYIEARQVKAMLKEATNIAYPKGEHKWGRYSNRGGNTVGGKAPMNFVAEHVWVPDVPIVVGEEISGSDMSVGHIEDYKAPGGKRANLGYFEYVDRPILTVTLEVLDDSIEEKQWARIWRVAERNGLGARRSQGCGCFAVTSWGRLD